MRFWTFRNGATGLKFHFWTFQIAASREVFAFLTPTTWRSALWPRLGRLAQAALSVMNKINNWSAVIEAHESLAGGGTRQAAIEARNQSRDALQKANMRMRFFYCSRSRRASRPARPLAWWPMRR